MRIKKFHRGPWIGQTNRKLAVSISESVFSSEALMPQIDRSILAEKTPEYLTDLQLMSQVLRLAIPEKAVTKIAFALMVQFGSYARAICASEAELRNIEGLGADGIHALRLLHMTTIRTLRSEITNRPVLKDWTALLKYLRALLVNDPIEKFHCLFLDTRNRLISDETISEGTTNFVHIYARELIKKTLAVNASAIILVHNHPSGDSAPSPDDIVMTRRLWNLFDALGIRLHDHIIIGRYGSYSFFESGLIKINNRKLRMEPEKISWVP